jgi:hypothetical protein
MVRIRTYSLVMSLPLLVVALGFLSGFLLGDGHSIIATYIVGAGIAFQAFLALVIACPKCGKSPYSIGPNWGPFSMAGKPFPETVCSKCGHDFKNGDGC